MLLGLYLDMSMELGEGKLLELDMLILGIGMLQKRPGRRYWIRICKWISWCRYCYW